MRYYQRQGRAKLPLSHSNPSVESDKTAMLRRKQYDGTVTRDMRVYINTKTTTEDKRI